MHSLTLLRQIANYYYQGQGGKSDETVCQWPFDVLAGSDPVRLRSGARPARSGVYSHSRGSLAGRSAQLERRAIGRG